MTNSDTTKPEPEMIGITIRANSEEDLRIGKKTITVRVPQNQLEIWDEEADRRGMDRSSIIRAFAAAGRRLFEEYDPNRVVSSEKKPLNDAIKKHVPISEENAESIEGIENSVTEEIRDKVWDVLIDDDEISRKGNKFYKQ